MTIQLHRRHSCSLGVALIAFLATEGRAMQAADWADGFIGPSSSGIVTEVASFDDGGGEKLYVATGAPFGSGFAELLRRFDGNRWEAFDVPVTGTIHSSCVWNDGTGNALYLGGDFTSVAGVAAQRVVRFDGTNWTPLSAGINGRVNSLVAFDDGSGMALYAGGLFDHSGSTPAHYVARWNGSSWIEVGPVFGEVNDLCVFDDGSGPALYAAHTGLGWHVGRWNGTAWTTVGGLFNDSIEDLHSLAGPGGGVFALGHFNNVGGLFSPAIARWNGTAWSQLSGAFIAGYCPHTGSMCTFQPSGGSPVVAIGGCFSSNNAALTSGLVQWDGSRLASIGLGQGIAGAVRMQAAFDDGSGEALYVAGEITAAGPTAVTDVARWNGASYKPLPMPFGINVHPLALEVLDDGSGPALYAGAKGVRRWTGSSWAALDAGMVPNSRVYAMCDWNDHGTRTLVAAVEEQFGAQYVMRWNGSSWSLLGDLFLGRILSLGVHDSGSGEELYAGGAFTSAGMALLAHVARWDGTAWAPLGNGLDGEVDDMVSFSDGSGPALYVGGTFNSAGSIPAAGVARWQNGAWSALGSGLVAGSRVKALCVHDAGTGSGRDLYAAGMFTSVVANGTARNVARWDGSTWNALGAGLQGFEAAANSIVAYRAPLASRSSLYVGGLFVHAGDRLATNICAYGIEEDGRPICFGDGQQQSCPCGNTSAVGAGAGCSNSQGHGGVLRSRGIASVSADTLELVGASMPPSSNVLYFQGTYAVRSGVGAPFAAGLRCAGGTTVRLYATQNSNGASSVPNVTMPTPVSVRGMVPASGGERVYQAWHRDAIMICGSTSNLTNGVLVTWRP
jgi:hypothetical protein